LNKTVHEPKGVPYSVKQAHDKLFPLTVD